MPRRILEKRITYIHQGKDNPQAQSPHVSQLNAGLMPGTIRNVSNHATNWYAARYRMPTHRHHAPPSPHRRLSTNILHPWYVSGTFFLRTQNVYFYSSRCLCENETHVSMAKNEELRIWYPLPKDATSTIFWFLWSRSWVGCATCDGRSS